MQDTHFVSCLPVVAFHVTMYIHER